MKATTTRAPWFSVVVPARDSASTIAACLESILAAADECTEVLVVDDSSSDGTVQVAGNYPARLLVTPAASGAAAARNLGAAAARGRFLVFIDADVVVPADTFQRLRSAFARRPEPAAVVGSYRAETPQPGFCTAYKHLQAHYIQTGYRRVFPYFLGFAGAIRRQVFYAVGGFDAARYPRGATVEDVELGYRLRAAGHRIELDRGWWVTHLKRYTLWSLVRSDLLNRCIPFVRLRWRSRNLRPEPSTDVHNVLSVAAIALCPLAGAGTGLGLITPGAGGLLAAAGLLLCTGFNLGFYRFVARRRSPLFALATVGLDLFGYAYRLVGLGLGIADLVSQGEPGAAGVEGGRPLPVPGGCDLPVKTRRECP